MQHVPNAVLFAVNLSFKVITSLLYIAVRKKNSAELR